MTDLSQYLGNFNAENYSSRYEYNTDEHPRFAIIKVLQEYGFKPPQAIPPYTGGQVPRFDAPGDKPGKRSGWCMYYETVNGDTTIGTLFFGSWTGNPFEQMKWSSKKTEYMSIQERNWHSAKMDHARQVIEQEKQTRNIEAAGEAERIFMKAPEAKEHGYITKKGIKPYRAKIYNEFLILPIYIDEKITSLQYIQEDSSKNFMPGGAIKGGYCILPGENSKIFICEGWATGCSIREATGQTVYVCYQSSNIYEATITAQKQNAESIVIIAADNDRQKPGNPGLSKATSVGQSLGVTVLAPTFDDNKGTDFNDLHQSNGLIAVKTQLNYIPIAKSVEVKERVPLPEGMQSPYKGFISDVTSYYNVTSGMDQPGFALQSALALSSFFLGRYFMTDQRNTTSLYFLNIGKTGTGKEHIKTALEEIMYETADQTHIGGDGFTSDGAVIGMLIFNPRSLVCLDEAGRYLGSTNAAGMAYQKAAITTLMEAISRTTGTLRAKAYSTFGINKDQADGIRNRYCVWPALTITANTTPETFYESISLQNIKDGFLGRFVLYESKAERQVFKDITIVDVPQSILDWVRVVKERTSIQRLNEDPLQKPDPIVIPFTEEAKKVKEAFAIEIIEKQIELDKRGIGGLLGRVTEFAMRMSLICALTRDPRTSVVEAQDMEWACAYMRNSANNMVESVNEGMTGSLYDGHRREILAAINDMGGISYKDMQGVLPFMKHKPRDLKEILTSLIDGEAVYIEPVQNERGKATHMYMITKPDDATEQNNATEQSQDSQIQTE